jgi:hypothetical protein
MAAPFVEDVVSVATDRNQISLRHPPTQMSRISGRREPLAVVVEVLAETNGIEPQPGLGARAESYDTEKISVLVDPSPGHGVPRCDVRCGEPLLGRRRRLGAKDLGYTSSDPLDALSV